ncbi:MAG: sugar kinase [Sedimentitalea sp.]
MVKVACIGEAMIELSQDRAAPDHAQIGFAGDTLNTAIYLKRCAPQLEVAYVTRLGNDTFSDQMIAMMQAEGLDTSLIGRSTSRRPGLYSIATDDTGERSFTYWRENSAARELFSSDPSDLEALSGADIVYFSAITLAILTEEARAALICWLASFRANGGRVVFDSNHRPALWANADTERTSVAQVWANCDIALPGLEDEQAIFGDADEQAVLARLRAAGVRGGALKRGADGPLPVEPDVQNAPFAQAEKVVDSTAAGDSFNGAYLASWLSGAEPGGAMQAGHDMAIRVLGVKGAIIPR